MGVFRSVPPEENLYNLGYDLRLISLPENKACYLPLVQSGDLLYLSGHLPMVPTFNDIHQGKVGSIYSISEAQKMAERAAVTMLRTIQGHLGSLDKIEKIVKVNGYVNCPPEFQEHSLVINGASELLVKVLGPVKGMHARTAVGVSSLPFNVPLEIDMIVQVKTN